jgi:hypothetical protein
MRQDTSTEFTVLVKCTLEVVAFELQPSGSEMVKPPFGKGCAVYFVESGMSPAGFVDACGTRTPDETESGGFAMAAPADVKTTMGLTSVATPATAARTILEIMN